MSEPSGTKGITNKISSLQDPSQNVDGEDIRNWLRQFLGGYQIPKKVFNCPTRLIPITNETNLDHRR